MRIRGTVFRIGADPEVFVFDNKRKRFVGSEGLIPGTKKNPYALDFRTKVQVDGMAAEFNTRPCHYPERFAREITGNKQAVNLWLKYNNGRYSLRVQSTVEFCEEEWARALDENKILGCDPDYNAYTLKTNKVPDASVTFRTGAGHIHLGWGVNFGMDNSYLEICACLAREQDAMNGVASLLYDQDTKRRTLYGKAGAFRPKPYGMEYRTLSNQWLKNAALSAYVARRSFQAVRNMMSGCMLQTSEVEGIINTNNVDDAVYFLKHNKITLPPSKCMVV